MKAIVQDKYGSPDQVLHLREVDKPQAGPGEVLVRVHAASVHPDVWHVVNGWPFVLRLMGSGLLRPKYRIPGTDLAGIVESVGRDVTRFAPGDEVFGETHAAFQWRNGGSFAEFAAVPQDTLAHKPRGISFEQAASVPTSGIIALHNLRSGNRLQAGRKILINGAGGGVGSLAVQIAKAHGAIVTGVDRAGKLEMVRSLGADRVIDPDKEDFLGSREGYDIVLDVASNLSFSDCRRMLAPAGIYILIGHDHYGKAGGRMFGSLPRFFMLTAMSPFSRKLPELDFSLPNKKDIMADLKALLETGKLTPIVARTYPLSGVPDAIRALQAGTALGKIVITP